MPRVTKGMAKAATKNYSAPSVLMICKLIKPRRMREGTVVVLCASKCVSVSATVLVATYLVYMSKVRRYTVSCRLLKIYRRIWLISACAYNSKWKGNMCLINDRRLYT